MVNVGLICNATVFLIETTTAKRPPPTLFRSICCVNHAPGATTRAPEVVLAAAIHGLLSVKPAFPAAIVNWLGVIHACSAAIRPPRGRRTAESMRDNGAICWGLEHASTVHFLLRVRCRSRADR